MIKLLGPEFDFPIKRMRLIANRSIGQDVDDVVDPSYLLSDARYARTYLNPDCAYYYCYGMVDDRSGQLQSVISIKHEPVHKKWLLQWLCSDSKINNGRVLNGVFDVVDHVIRLGEIDGMDSWVGCIPAKYKHVYDRLWRRHCSAYAGYEIESSALVPANSVTANTEHFGEMFGHVVQPIDMLVRTHKRRA